MNLNYLPNIYLTEGISGITEKKLYNALDSLVKKIKTMADSSGNHIENLKQMFYQVSEKYKKNGNNILIDKLTPLLNTPSDYTSAISIVMLTMSLINNNYNKDMINNIIKLCIERFKNISTNYTYGNKDLIIKEDYTTNLNYDVHTKYDDYADTRIEDPNQTAMTFSNFMGENSLLYDYAYNKQITNKPALIKEIYKVLNYLERLYRSNSAKYILEYPHGIENVKELIKYIKTGKKQDFQVNEEFVMKKRVNESNIDLKYLPSSVVAWLFDKRDNQVKAAKDIAVAAHETGNDIVKGSLLKIDKNILVLKDKMGKGSFHVYPDGGISFNGEMIDGHEDVERLIGQFDGEEYDVAEHEAETIQSPLDASIEDHYEQYAEAGYHDDSCPYCGEDEQHCHCHDTAENIRQENPPEIFTLTFEDILDENIINEKKGAFKKLEKKLADEGYSKKSAGSIAYSVGVKKFGKKGMAKKSAAGRKK